MSNWTDYVMNYASKHGITYGEALKKARPSYRKKYGGVVLGGKRKKPMSGSKTMRRPAKKVMRGGKAKKRSSKLVGVRSYARKYPDMVKAGRQLGKVLGGAKPKGALAALLSGLNASVKVE